MMFRALLTIGGVQIVTMLLLLVRTKSLAVMLGPEAVGVMAVIDKLLAVIAQTVSLSLPFAAVRFLPERWTAGPEEFLDLFTRMRNVLLALILTATAIALLVTVFWPSTWGAALVSYHDVLLVAIIGLPTIAFIPFLQNAIAGRLQQNRSMVLGLLHALVVALSVIAIWHNGLAGYYAAYAAIGTMLVLVVMYVMSRDASMPEKLQRTRARFSLGLPKQVWRFSGALLILTFLSPFAALYVHYQLLSVHGAETAGWMQAAIGISLSVRAVLGSAHSVFLTPNVNRGGGPEDRMTWANNFQSMFCLIAGLALPPLLLFPDLAIHILYSSEFAQGSVFVMLFVFAEVMILLSGTYQSLVIALDNMPFHVLSNLLAQLLVVGLAYLLVGPFGILGAGLAVLAAPVFMYISTMIFLNHSFGIRMPGRVVACSGWLLLCVLISGFTGAWLHGFSWEVLLTKSGVYCVAAGGFMLLLTAAERQQIRIKIAKWKARWT